MKAARRLLPSRYACHLPLGGRLTIQTFAKGEDFIAKRYHPTASDIFRQRRISLRSSASPSPQAFQLPQANFKNSAGIHFKNEVHFIAKPRFALQAFQLPKANFKNSAGIHFKNPSRDSFHCEAPPLSLPPRGRGTACGGRRVR